MPEILPLDTHNKKLVDNVRPDDWQNPEPPDKYDVVVIGAGTGGLISSIGTSMLGLKTAIIERYYYGGDCLNYGCVPSKGLLASSKLIKGIRESDRYGVSTPGFSVDFTKVMDRMREVRAGISRHDAVHRLKEMGIDPYIGEAKFVSEDTVKVGDMDLKFRKCIITSGARAVNLPIPGLKETGYLTNENLFNLTELPKRLIVIGAGPIGCEMAQAFNNFGSEVHVVSLDDVVLPREDRETSLYMTSLLQKYGIKLHLGAKILKTEILEGLKRVHYEQDGVQKHVDGNEILVAIGRAPNVELDLENAGIEYDKRGGVKVDKYLRTSNKRVLAAGDICSVYKFTHAAEAMAKIAVQNACFPFKKVNVEKLIIPWCTYTHPEIAHVGKFMYELDKENVTYKRIHIELKDVDRYQLDGHTEGFLDVFVDPKGKIYGATIVAHNAGELIGYIVYAMANNKGIGSLNNIIYPYPVSAMLLKRAAGQYLSTKLTEKVKKLLRGYFAVWRLFH